MIAELSTVFRGPLAPYAEALRLAADDASGRPGTELADPSALKPHLDRFAQRYATPDPRAVGSLWLKHHIAAVLTPVLAANLLLDRQMPVALDDIRFLPGADGVVEGLVLPHTGEPVIRAAPFTRFQTLLEGHIAPVVRAAAKASGATPKVLWGNVGNWFDLLTGEAAAMGAAGAGEAHALLAAAHTPDGTRNPLFAPVRHTLEGRRRKVCCLRYLIPELDLCDTCPRPEAVRP